MMTALTRPSDTRLELADTLPPETHYLPARRHWLTLRVNRKSRLVWFVLFCGMLPLILFAPFGIFASYLGATGLLLAGATYTFVVTYRASEESQRAQLLLMAGKIGEASAILEHLCATQQDHPHHAVFVFQRALAYTREGRHRRAFSLFNAVYRSRVFERRGLRSYAGLAESMMAYTLALTGELDDAERFLREADAKLSPEHRGGLVFPRTVLLARRGQLATARAYVADHHRELTSGEATKRAMRLVWAWLASHDSAGSQEAKRLLDGLYPVEPGEFDWVCTDWPELAAFVRSIDPR